MIIAQIHNVYKQLTNTEQKIASYILAAPERVVHMTVKELASACDTVPSAVHRMCKSVGAEGFSELKILLAGELGQAAVHGQSVPFSKEDTPQEIFKKVFHSGVHALKNTCEMLDFAAIEKISKQLAGANRVLLFGIGTSSVVVLDAAYRFSQLGMQAYAYSDILQMNVMARNLKPGDVAFGISHSGTTKAVVDAMRAAKEAGATTVALTSFQKSLLCRESEYAIAVYADEANYPVEAVSARIAHMCVVDALMMTIASLNYEDYSEHIAMRNAVLDEIRY